MRTSFLPQLRSPHNTAAASDDWITKARLAAPRKHHVVETIARHHHLEPSDFEQQHGAASPEVPARGEGALSDGGEEAVGHLRKASWRGDAEQSSAVNTTL